MFLNERSLSGEQWIDKDGTAFRPHKQYFVDGNTKFDGAILFRRQPVRRRHELLPVEQRGEPGADRDGERAPVGDRLIERLGAPAARRLPVEVMS